MRATRTPAGGTPVLRALNTSRVLRAVRRAAPDAVRIADLIEATGLARPTVTQVVAQLVRSDLVVEEPEERETGRMGRPAQVYRLNRLARPVLGVDIGVHSVTVAVADSSGEVLALRREPVGRPRVEDLAAALDRAVVTGLADAAVRPDRIAAITAATPGVVDPGNGEILLVPAISGWRSFRVREHLQRTFACTVEVENDANAAVVSVAANSPELGDPLLVVHWGERVGSGIYVSGELHRGAHHAAGEIGLVPAVLVTPEGAVEGHLQDLISTTAIGGLADTAARAEPGGTLARLLASASEGTHPAALFTAATRGDVTAAAVVSSIVRTFTQALAPVVLALDPKAVVISGGITRAGDVLSTSIEDALAAVTLHHCPVVLSADSENTVVKGAVQLALRTAWADLEALGVDGTVADASRSD